MPSILEEGIKSREQHFSQAKLEMPFKWLITKRQIHQIPSSWQTAKYTREKSMHVDIHMQFWARDYGSIKLPIW